MNCLYCSHPAVKNGNYCLKDGTNIQTYRCRFCGKCFNERQVTPMVNLEPNKPEAKLLSSLQEENEILREQVESLKQQLDYERQVAEEYLQELNHTNDELNLMNRELTTLYSSLAKPGIDHTKELANTSSTSRKLTSKFLVYLLGDIYGVRVQPNELELGKMSSISSTSFENDHINNLKENRKKCRNEFNALKAQYEINQDIFISLTAIFLEKKAQETELKTNLYRENNGLNLPLKSSYPPPKFNQF